MNPYERLSAQDLSFLYAESASQPMHVGALCVFDRVDASRREILDYFDTCSAKIPRLRKRLVRVPGDLARPVLVDDPDWEVTRHVHVVANPRPFDHEDALHFVAELMSTPLNRRRPLWGAWLFDMTDDRTGAIMLIHHCLADGIAALRLAAGLLSISPDAPPEPDEDEDELALVGDEQPNAMTLLSGAATDLVGRSVQLAAGAAGNLVSVRDNVERARRVVPSGITGASTLLAGFGRSPRSSLTKPVGESRVAGTARVALADVRKIKAEHDCTVNDVVLSCVAGAVRALLLSRGEQVDDVVVRASIPVNVRAADDERDSANAVSTIIVGLPIGTADPADRLQAITAQTTALKSSGGISGFTLFMDLADLAPPAMLRAVSRLAARSTPAELLVSNLPGPPIPLYLLGSELREIVPFVPVLGTTSMTIAVMSYLDDLLFGVCADPEVVGPLAPLLTRLPIEIDHLGSGVA